MEEKIFDILKIIIPVIMTGLFSLFIAKFTYNKNRPLDKIEIAYNRVYYPIYRFIKNNPNNIKETKEKLQNYFVKYAKYIDFSTMKTFDSLCKSTKAEEKSAYQKFSDNIYAMNTYLRKRLGYLEPNILQLYKYAMFKSQITFWCIFAFLGSFLFLIFTFIFNDPISINSMALSIVCFFIFLTLLIIRFLIFLFYKFINIFKKK